MALVETIPLPPETSSGFIPFKSYQTFYKAWGSDPRELPGGSLPPLIVLHGGPGILHNYMLPHADLAKIGGNGVGKERTVILYDQVGCGKSTPLKEKKGDKDFWSIELFKEELSNLLEYFGLGGNNGKEYDIMGHSWGGILASEHALTHPKGLRKMVISSTPSSVDIWHKLRSARRAQFPKEVLELLEKHEKEGTTKSDEYQGAVMVNYAARFICKKLPLAHCFIESFSALKDDDTVASAMYGDMWNCEGILRPWTIFSRVDQINVPTLVTCGKYDEATDEVIMPWVNGIKGAKYACFQNSAHLAHIEERDEVMNTVHNFLLD